jgi:hypothetical protein
MHTLRLRWHSEYRGVAAGLAVVLTLGLLVLALLCHPLVPGISQGGQEVCQHFPWLLYPASTIPFVAAGAWFSRTFQLGFSREHPLLVVKPPRLRPQ